MKWNAYGLIGGGGGGDRALRAAVSGVGGVDDGDLGWVRGSSIAAGGDWVGNGEEREEEGCDLGMHFDCCLRQIYRSIGVWIRPGEVIGCCRSELMIIIEGTITGLYTRIS